jgi:hypothetical protein
MQSSIGTDSSKLKGTCDLVGTLRAVVISRISKECWFQAQDGMGTRAVFAELKR